MVAIYNILRKNPAEIKSIKEKDLSLGVNYDQVDTCQKEKILIKEQQDQINKLKLEQENLNYRHCRVITGFHTQISDLKNKLKKKSEESSEEIILKEKLVAYDQRLKIYEETFKQNEKESDVFMHLLSIIFPKIKTDKKLDNISFIKILENKVK